MGAGGGKILYSPNGIHSNMPFDIKIENILPPTDVQDPDAVALVFLNSIGYMSRGYDPKTPVESVRSSVPFRLFMDCLMGHPGKDWRVEDLAQELGTSIPTVYRHLGKLQAYDIIDEDVGDDGKSVHLKHYSLPGAWKVTEANVTASMENIKRSVETIQALLERTGSGKTEGQPADSHGPSASGYAVRRQRLMMVPMWTSTSSGSSTISNI